MVHQFQYSPRQDEVWTVTRLCEDFFLEKGILIQVAISKNFFRHWFDQSKNLWDWGCNFQTRSDLIIQESMKCHSCHLSRSLKDTDFKVLLTRYFPDWEGVCRECYWIYPLIWIQNTLSYDQGVQQAQVFVDLNRWLLNTTNTTTTTWKLKILRPREIFHLHFHSVKNVSHLSLIWSKCLLKL